MTLVNSLSELVDNVLYLERKLILHENAEQLKAADLIKRGTCFLRYTMSDKILFAPSRFIGYKNNSISAHSRSDTHGTRTNARIKKILGQEPVASKNFDAEYKNFCAYHSIAINATGNFGNERKFWDLDKFVTDVYGDIELPEGRKKYVMHLRRERSPRIRRIAISNFLINHPRLHCEACKFDFYNVYGDIGKDFIECHHTIPLSKMKAGHKTKPDDIVLLCSNCHRIIHKSKEWLTVQQLKDILEKSQMSTVKKFVKH